MSHHLPLPLLLLLLALVACGAAADAGPQPPDIAYGQDVCDACGMVIDQPKFAAATVLTNTESHKFGDIGDMLVYHMDHPDQTVVAWFVHDYHSEEWIDAQTAFYVMSPQLITPMGFGVAAFADQAQAAQLAQELGANVMTFDEVELAIHLKVHG